MNACPRFEVIKRSVCIEGARRAFAWAKVHCAKLDVVKLVKEGLPEGKDHRDPSVRPFIKSESWPVVGFCPHVTSTGVFGINLSTLYPNFGSFEGGVQHNEPGNQTIRLYHSHLATEVYNFKFWRSP